jgi:hypothetical protein
VTGRDAEGEGEEDWRALAGGFVEGRVVPALPDPV